MRRVRMDRGSGNPIPPAVRLKVRARSKGFCEVCPRGATKATDMHHLCKRPRLHEHWAIVHLCRRHHDMCEGPYDVGRLVFGEPSPDTLQLEWSIEVRSRKHGPILMVLGHGRIQMAPVGDAA